MLQKRRGDNGLATHWIGGKDPNGNSKLLIVTIITFLKITLIMPRHPFPKKTLHSSQMHNSEEKTFKHRYHKQ